MSETAISTRTYQPAILAPIAAHGRSLAFRLLPGCQPAAALASLQAIWEPHWGVVGLGEALILALGSTVPGLRTFPALAGACCSLPSTQAALWIGLRSEDRSALFNYGEQIKVALDGAFALDDALDTFHYAGGRDLSGYEDGTENPDDKASPAVALVAQGSLAGSSFVAVQRWVHDLKQFRSMNQNERDNIIGRKLDTNEELDDAPTSAHVKRSAQESFTPEAFMMRRSMPWSNVHEQGLEFIAFARSLDPFEQIMRRMLGLEDSIIDALFRFSRPLTGGYYWCPALREGKLDLTPLAFS